MFTPSWRRTRWAGGNHGAPSGRRRPESAGVFVSMCPGYGRRSPGRLRLKDLLWRIDLTLAPASLAIVRNKTYLQQYVDRGVPAVLGYRDREALAWPICSSASPGNYATRACRLRPSLRSQSRLQPGPGRLTGSSSPVPRAGTSERI